MKRNISPRRGYTGCADAKSDIRIARKATAVAGYVLACAATLLATFPAAAASLDVGVMSIGADIRGTNPGVDRDDMTDAVVAHLVEGLVAYRANGTVAPLLASKVDMSADGLTYTFALRQGVKFQNGEPLTPASVIWSWKRYLDPKTHWSCLASFDGRNGPKITDISAVGSNAVAFKIDRPSATFLVNMAQLDCGGGAIFDKASVNADGSWKAPVGTGPYKLTEWKHGQYVQIDRYDGYVSPPGVEPDGYVGNKTPKIRDWRFTVIPDLATVEAALNSGAVDVANIPETDIEQMRNGGKVNIVETPVRVKRSMLMNTADPLLQNKLLRQAIAHAIDVNSLVAAASNNVSKPNESVIDPQSPFYSEIQQERNAYDPALAAKLLKASGYHGQVLTISTDNRPTVPLYNMALFIQQMLTAVGIQSKLEVTDFANVMNKYYSGKFQLMVFSYSSRLDPALSYEQIAGAKSAQPWKVWDDTAVTKQIEAASAESDPAKRQVIFDALHRKMLDESPLLVFYNGVDIKAVSKRMSGVTSFEFKPQLWSASIK